VSDLPDAFEQAFAHPDDPAVGCISFKYSRFTPDSKYVVTTLMVGIEQHALNEPLASLF
jgi:hypothetical protein